MFPCLKEHKHIKKCLNPKNPPVLNRWNKGAGGGNVLEKTLKQFVKYLLLTGYAGEVVVPFQEVLENQKLCWVIFTMIWEQGLNKSI